MIENRGQNIPTYRDLSEGIHPDITDSVAQKMSPSERVRLATNLTLRDIFTPACEIVQETLIARDPEHLTELIAQFRGQPKEHSYPGSKVELDNTLDQTDDIDLRSILRRIKANTYEKADLKAHDTPIEATGTFNSFCFVGTQVNHEINWPEIIVPVGEYGFDTASRVAQTGRILMHLAESELLQEMQRIAQQYGNILIEATARARDDGLRERSLSAMATMMEGIDSLCGALGFLLAEKIDGYENGDKVVEALIRNNLPNQLAAKIQGGFLMPMILEGKYIPGVVVNKDDELHIGADAKRIFAEDTEKKIQDQKNPDLSKLLEVFPNLANLFGGVDGANKLSQNIDPEEFYQLHGNNYEGCPVAKKSKVHKKSGIELLSETFLQIYQSL